MKFRAKLTIAMVLLLSLTYGIGGSLMIAQSFSSSIDRERDAAVQTYRMVVDVLELLGDNASPGTAANTVALVLHKLGSGGSSTAARIRFGAQMTTTGDTALLDEAPEPPAGSGGPASCTPATAGTTSCSAPRPTARPSSSRST